MAYLTDLFSSHMGHGSEHLPTLYAHLMFAFRGVVFNDIFFPNEHHSENLFLSFNCFPFYIQTGV